MDQLENIKDRNIIIFRLPTPIKKNLAPDISFIKDALNSLRKFLSNDLLLILESTVYPGVTKEIFKNFINKNFSDIKNRLWFFIREN